MHQAIVHTCRGASFVSWDLAPVHHTPWMDAMDDSLEAFLAKETAKPAKEPA